MKLSVTTLEAQSAGELDLADEVFGLEARSDILHRVVNWQLAKRRAGTHRIKLRGEIARTTKKMYKQKGTGGARHGARSAAQFVGGAKAHGPVCRSHAFDLPKKVRALGLRHALSVKAFKGDLVILDEAILKGPKTADLKVMLDKLGLVNALFITGAEVDANFKLAARNIPNVDVLPTIGANVYDILRRHKLVLTREAVVALEARLK